jgi:adenine-specific DNA-methyltransferase
MQDLYIELIELLQADQAFIIDDKLNKGLIIDRALKLDPALIKLLLTHPNIKRQFFVDIEGILVFDKVAFQRFVNTKNFLPDSYTQYKNKIGLSTDNDHYITDSREVVLVWPHKDCVLEGGQTKEDAKRNEIFYNTTLAPDEIDVLTAPKVLTNWKRYDKDGETIPTKISKADNLIIKGNNLLALHTLKEKYRGQVKLIYIDPPYNTNTSANTFSYNNSFNHSSWLTFMKNRLEVAKSMLRNDGFFACAIDHYELFYLGMLCDEIFGRENRIGVIAIVHNPGGRQDDKFFPTAHENMIVYAKNIEQAKINTLGVSEEKLKEFKLTDENGRYKLRGFRRSGNNSNREDGPGLYYPVYYDTVANKLYTEKVTAELVEILPHDDNGKEKCWRWGKDTFNSKKEKYIEVKKVNNKLDIYVKERESDYEGEKAKTFWINPKYTGQTGTQSLKLAFGEKTFSYPKSPNLMFDIVKIFTNKNDIVLDYHAGSATTAHAVLELNKQDEGNRKFIICEQMDYIKTVTVPRVQKVIENIGSSSFIYAELLQSNQNYITQIQVAKTTKVLLKIWDEMQATAFISYKVLPENINKEIKDFEALSIEEQQRFLVEILDKNLLYVNKSEINDARHNVSEPDKAMNSQFYNM